MSERALPLLPLHRVLDAFEGWRLEQSDEAVERLRAAVAGLAPAYDVGGVRIAVNAAPLAPLEIGVGSLGTGGARNGAPLTTRSVLVAQRPDRTAMIEIDAGAKPADLIVDALELTLSAVWAREEAAIQAQQLDALDAAVRGIAGVLTVDAVLQLIVDQVRELVGAEYAALGIVGPFGNIEQFVTSGLSSEQRERIGPLPRGHGLLGLIMRENSSFLIDDIGLDARRHGFPPNHPEMHSFLGAPVRSKGLTIGNLYLTNKRTAPTFSDADLRLVEMFALHAGIAMENARLHEEVQRLAVVDERQRISEDLHDSIIQSLYAISLSLEDLPEIAAEDAADGRARADQAIDSIHGTIREIRNLIFGLQPELLEGGDLQTGIASLADEFRRNTVIDLDVHVADDLPIVPADHAAQLLLITREALSNIARHSRATRASLNLESAGPAVRLTVGDNGEGFDVAKARNAGQHGLTNLRSRAEGTGGQLSIVSAPGAGTRMVAEVPIERGP